MIAADIARQQERCDLSLDELLQHYDIKRSTYYDWQRLPSVPAPPKKLPVSTASPRPEEIQAVLAYRDLHPDIGYRKFTWQMVDGNIAFLSESKVYDILSEHNRLQGWNRIDNGETAKEYRHKPKHVHYIVS